MKRPLTSLLFISSLLAFGQAQLVDVTPTPGSLQQWSQLRSLSEDGSLVAHTGPYSHQFGGFSFLYQDGIRTELRYGPELYSFAHAVNRLGDIVGVAQKDAESQASAFLYRNGQMLDLGTLGGYQSEAASINDHGVVVGTFWLTSTGPYHAFIYENGAMRDLGTLGGTYSAAYKVNNAGDVLGWSAPLGDWPYKQFLVRDGQMIDLDALVGYPTLNIGLNERRDVWGEFWDTSSRRHGFLYRDGNLIDLTLGGSACDIIRVTETGIVAAVASYPDESSTVLLYRDGVRTELRPNGVGCGFEDMNEAGDVAGYAQMPDGQIQGYVFRGGVMTALTLGGSRSWAQDINAQGDVVGVASSPGDSEFRVFLDTNVGGFRTLDPLPDGSRPFGALINDAGDIVVSGRKVGENGPTCHIFHWRDGIWSDLGNVGQVGEVVKLTESGYVCAMGYLSIRPVVQHLYLARIDVSMLSALESQIGVYYQIGAIDAQVVGSLTAKVDAAQDALERNNPNAPITAMNDLKALTNLIKAQTNRKITPAAAADLIARANAIIARLNQ